MLAIGHVADRYADAAPERSLARAALPGSGTAPSGGTIELADADPAPAQSLAPAPSRRSVTAKSGGTVEIADADADADDARAPAALPRAKPLLTLTPPAGITGGTDAELVGQPLVPVKPVARALIPAAPWQGLTDRTAPVHALTPALTDRPAARAITARPPGRTVAAARALEQLRARAAEHTASTPSDSDPADEPSTILSASAKQPPTPAAQTSTAQASTPQTATREAASAAFAPELDATPATTGGDAE